jgi:exopolysaccharide biosynthesis polyprenyl glycosylphosphotransferase
MNNGRTRKIVYIFRLAVDSLMILIAWFGSTVIRFHIIDNLNYRAQLPDILFSAPIILILNIYLFHVNGLYTLNRYTSWTKEMYGVIKSATQSFMGSVLLFYFIRYSLFSRLTLVIFYILLLIMLVSGRVILHNIMLQLRKSGFNQKRVILVGRGKEMEIYLDMIKSQPALGIKPIGWYDPLLKNPHEDIEVIEGSLNEFINSHQADSLVVCQGKESADAFHSYQKEIYNMLIPVIVLSDREYNFLNVHVDNLPQLTLLHQNRANFNMTDRLLKRIIDIASALIALIGFSPVYIIVAILIKLTSSGPVFYGQKRMTRDGEIFTMWKFRSMQVDAESGTGAVWAKKNDNRTTPIGSFLRKTSLDEIPQFWNILKGEMSLVGPRPERPELIEGFKEEIPGYMIRHKVKAGLTGWAQVNGWRGNTSLYRRIEYDISYINDWTIWLDIKIIFLTFFKGFIHKNAY